MSNGINWTNKSVLAFARDQDPIEVMEERARVAVLGAMDQGWKGPPFDPIALAQILKLSIAPRADISDARTIPGKSGLSIEFNPLRPRGRLRFSIAHEIAHTFFPDCAEAVRERGGFHPHQSDSWQLEVLCNIGAAELLMPTGSFPELGSCQLDIGPLLRLRKTFDVSTEALLIRATKLTKSPCAAFCASFDELSSSYRLDYVIPSSTWSAPIRAGIKLPKHTLVSDANAIGYTAKGFEQWGGQRLAIECVALAPYPSELIPRIVGILSAPNTIARKGLSIRKVIGDALIPRGDGPKIVAHVIPDSTVTWGGGGFAAQMRKRYPEVASEFKNALSRSGQKLRAGMSFTGKIDSGTHVFHMVAQRGHGKEPGIRIRYSALASCLSELKTWAVELGASVHMPRIGTGYGGGDWTVIQELIHDELVRKGIEVIIYQVPDFGGD